LLQEKSISYNEIDIEHTPGARAKLRELTGGTLTTSPFVIGQETIVDFQPDRRDRALRARLI
jgi:glutaredoxin